MKSQLRLEAHSVLSGQNIIEVWHGGQLIATVTGADGPGVRVISKHPISTRLANTPPVQVNAMEVTMDVTKVAPNK